MAETEGFEVLVTTDSQLEHQQNLTQRRIAIVVLSTSWPRIEHAFQTIRSNVDVATPGSYQEIAIP